MVEFCEAKNSNIEIFKKLRARKKFQKSFFLQSEIFILKKFSNFFSKFLLSWVQKIRIKFLVSDIMSIRSGRSGLVSNEEEVHESSRLYSAVYLVPGGASSSYSGDCSALDEDCEEGKPLLSSEITSDSIKRNKMAENAPKTTPGLNETVQEFKAREGHTYDGFQSECKCFIRLDITPVARM